MASSASTFAQMLSREVEREIARDRKRGREIGRSTTSGQPAAKKARVAEISRMGGAIAAPVSGGIVTRPAVPKFSSVGDSTIVRNTEILFNVTLAAAGGFSTLNTPLQAGQPAWLAQIGDLYSKFRWRRLRIIYSPKCPTTTSGSVVMAFTYDRNDGAPVSRTQLAQSYKAINFPPYAGYDGASALNTPFKPNPGAIYIDLDTTRMDKPWYPTISTAAFAALAIIDQNQFCPATLVLAADGGPVAATPAGDIFIQYEIEFIEPINPTMNI